MPQSGIEQEAPEPEKPEGIPITEVTDHAQKMHIALNKTRTNLERIPAIIKIENQLPVFLYSLKRLRSDLLYQPIERMPRRKLRQLIYEWDLRLNKLNTWDDMLSQRSKSCEENVRQLEEMIVLWQITSEKAIAEEAPAVIQGRIKSNLDEIKVVKTRLFKRIEVLLTLRDRISDDQLEVTKLIGLIENAESEFGKHFFVRDSLPLWESIQAGKDNMNFGSQILDSFSDFFQDNKAFVYAYHVHFYVHMFIFAALLVLMFYLYYRNKHDQLLVEDDKTLKSSVFFVLYPFSAALLIALFLASVIYPTQHVEFRELVLLLMLIPIARIVPDIIPSELRKPLYFLVGLCVLDFLENIVEQHVFQQRLGLLLFTIIAISLLAFWLRPGSPIYQTKSRFSYKIAVWMGPLTLIILLVSLVTNVIGSLSMSHKLVRGTVECVLVTVTIYVVMQVFNGLVILLIRRRSAKALRLVQTYAKQMEQRAILCIRFAAIFFWLRGILWIFGFYQPVLDWLSIHLTETWAFGTVEISIGAIFSFFIILVITFVLARLVRLFLDLEIFPRLRLPRGIPSAISMVIGYTIIGFGFFLAISTAGVDLERFGLLAGAMGVGLGFGLRNIIENYFSGLILVFTRPIQVGDTIEIDDVMGNVKQIGIRSSTIMTFDDCEVIVPNSDIISNRVSNWTLSNQQRRIKLPVKVAYGNEPDRVLELLNKAVREHKGVLEFPEPFATFNGFGDNYLDFTLYYWISDNILKYKSEVALGVHNIIKEAGIDTPRPKGDFNLKIIDAPDKQQNKDKGNIDKNR